LIFKFHTKDPGAVKAKLEEIVGFATMMAGSLPPPFNTFVSKIKFEFHVEEGHAITLGIHTEDKLVQFALDILKSNIHSSGLEKAKATVHLRLSANGSLEDLTSDKYSGDLNKIISEGFAANFDISTNADAFVKTILN